MIVNWRLRATLPRRTEMADFSRAHPGLRLELLDRLEIERRLVLFEVRLISDEERSWDDELRQLPSAKEVELLDVTRSVETYRVLVSDSTFIPLFRRLKLIRHFPIPIQDGVATWTVVGTVSRVQDLVATLESTRVTYEVVSVRNTRLARDPSLLTPRQREILHRALFEGYFDVPRRVSLTELAPKVGVATSTLSVTLAVIEKKIVESHPLYGVSPMTGAFEPSRAPLHSSTPTLS